LIKPYLGGKIKLKKQEGEVITSSSVNKNDAFIKPDFIKAAMEGKDSTQEWTIPFMKRGKEDFKMTPSSSSIEHFIRAMQPWPIAWTTVKIDKNSAPKRLKILKAHLDGKKLVLDEVQLEGKNKVSWEQFKQGYPTAIFE
jgi:methionyl-tRNA formyltransferase